MNESTDIDTDLLGKLNAGAGTIAPAIDASTDDIDAGLLHQLNSPSATSHAAVANKPVHHNPPTRFQKSAAPAPDEPEMSWADIGKEALHNALPSLGGAGKAMLVWAGDTFVNGTPLMARTGHTSALSLARYTRVSAEALQRDQAERDPARRR